MMVAVVDRWCLASGPAVVSGGRRWAPVTGWQDVATTQVVTRGHSNDCNHMLAGDDMSVAFRGRRVPVRGQSAWNLCQ
ncbi:hypothetical protein Tco_0223884 [Tanacetum coccineum]